MAILEITLAILGVIILFVLSFKLLKNVVKAALVVLMIISLVSLAFGIYVYRDVQDIQENFLTEDKLFIFEDDGNIISAFTAKSLNLEDIEFKTDAQIANLSEYLSENSYDALLADNYKVISFDMTIFDAIIDKGIYFEDMGMLAQMGVEEKIFLDKEKINLTLNSDDPRNIILGDVFDKIVEAQIKNSFPAGVMIPASVREQLKTRAFEQINAKMGNGGEQEFKTMILMMLLKEKVAIDGVKGILTNYKEDLIVVYPETPVFKSIKFTPTLVFDKIKSLNQEIVKSDNDRINLTKI
ncbi:hypothetical protein BVX95_01500 [archaeon D22]|nr:hypothetical protein BVX95_01500 [archaeon D22]